MTTIAYRDGVLAADTQHSSDGVIVGFRSKIDGLPDGTWLATKGCAGYGRALLEWLRNSRAGQQPSGEGGGILLHLDGSLEAFEGAQSEMISGAEFYAFGSGQQIALGAMHAGASASQAVQAAIDLDCYSGGTVTAVSISSAPQVESDKSREDQS